MSTAARHTMTEINAVADLDTLRRLLLEDDAAVEAERRDSNPNAESEIDWTSLPSFGGAEIDGQGIWSADASRLLVGTCADDLKIVARAEWAEARATRRPEAR